MGLDDLDQLVLTSFLNTLEEIAISQRRNRTALDLRQNTRRSVFRALRRKQKENKQQRQLVDLTAMLDGINPLDDIKATKTVFNAHEMARLLNYVTHEIIPREHIDVVIATYLHGERLKDYVNRIFPADNEQQARKNYQRIKRQRLRTMERLRGLLHDYSSPLLEREELLPSNGSEKEEETEFPAPESWTPEVFQ